MLTTNTDASAETGLGPGDLVGLGSVDGTMLGLVGGKAVGLGVMTAAEFPVPAGFCVATAAYRRSVSLDGVLEEFDRATTEEDLVRLAGDARRRIMSAPVPPDLAESVAAAYRLLAVEKAPAVAVRSSATTEDLPEASFAGQHDTYLDVRGVGKVLDAVRRCWASLWSDRAVLYRAANGVDQREAEIAVVVQVMVEARHAGVLFTVDPMSERRTEMVVEAVAGLGEGLVSGTVRPDQYRIGPGAVSVRGSGELSRAQLRELWALGRCLEELFGSPQDIEWAYDTSGRLWITQSRPITTLFPVPEAAQERPRVYWSLNAYQGLTQPFTPIGAYLIRLRQMSFQPGLAGSGIAPQIPGVHGWLYWDVTDGAYSDSRRARLAHLIDAFTAPAGRALLDHADELRPSSGIDPLACAPPREHRAHWWRVVYALAFPRAARAGIVARSEKLVSRYAGPARASAEERLDFVERVAPEVARIELDLPREYAGQRAAQIGSRLLSRVAGEAEINAVFRGVPGNPTTEMDLSLWRLSRRIRDDAACAALFAEHDPARLAAGYAAETLPETLQQGVSRFLREYGFRARAEIDLGVPRWSNDPEPVFAMLATYLLTTDPAQDAERYFTDAAHAAERTLRELVGRLPLRRLPHAVAAGFMLRRSRALRGLREHGKVYLMRGYAHIRDQLLLIGEDLVRHGRLTRREDVMFLVPAELRSGLGGEDLRATADERRARYERECRRPRVPSLVLSDGRALELRGQPAGDSSGQSLRGLAAASGVVTATARVVHDPNAVQLQPGEILVVAATDPGWTPLFLTAGALVSETGGLTSHGTTVAREYGIPAVVGVSDATRVIRTGDRITVDGSAGTVTIHHD
ncbi:PEP/pyruvate-binding domain-containing protein [Nonomuraea sp. NPDC059023]|uniref:PEP/pyruvate-binding domain-containing protein n=1 Tax=unclassified Nonomuraea TaxID=2593643 RepID=UPI00367D163E